MDVKLDKWFRPKIDKEVLKELTKKSDLKGLIHISVYFSFLIFQDYWLIKHGELCGQFFGFMFMEIFFAFVIQFGMKLGIRQLLKLNF